LGVPRLNCLAGKRLPGCSQEEHWRTLLENVRFAARALAEKKLILLVEAINVLDVPGFFLNRTSQVLRLVSEAGLTNVMVQYDVYHAQREEGEIVADLASDEAFAGYWRRPDADAKAIRRGWYFTGDTGYVDEAGDLFVTGRVDDMIITGGENVSPGEIESVLSLHPAVAEVAVAGLADERWGKRIVAFVKRALAVDGAALDQWCQRSSLADFKRPRDYVFVREIPKSPVGKILRRKLVVGEFDVETSLAPATGNAA